MTDGENRRLGAYVETTTGGERVRAYVPAPLPPVPPLDLARFMRCYERALAAVGRLDGVTTILPSTPLRTFLPTFTSGRFLPWRSTFRCLRLLQKTEPLWWMNSL